MRWKSRGPIDSPKALEVRERKIFLWLPHRLSDGYIYWWTYAIITEQYLMQFEWDFGMVIPVGMAWQTVRVDPYVEPDRNQGSFY